MKTQMRQMRTIRRPATGLLVCAAIGVSSLAFGQTPATPTEPSVRYVAIGCLSRQGTAAAPRFVVTDTRGNTSTVYRLTGDAAVLAPHVGHTVEVAGALTTPAGTGQSILKVNSLVWIASSCKR